MCSDKKWVCWICKINTFQDSKYNKIVLRGRGANIKNIQKEDQW